VYYNEREYTHYFKKNMAAKTRIQSTVIHHKLYSDILISAI